MGGVGDAIASIFFSFFVDHKKLRLRDVQVKKGAQSDLLSVREIIRALR